MAGNAARIKVKAINKNGGRVKVKQSRAAQSREGQVRRTADQGRVPSHAKTRQSR